MELSKRWNHFSVVGHREQSYMLLEATWPLVANLRFLQPSFFVGGANIDQRAGDVWGLLVNIRLSESRLRMPDGAWGWA